MTSIKADVFPTNVRRITSDGTETSIERVRAIITSDDRLIVFADSSTGPAKVVDEQLTSYSPPKMANLLREVWDEPYTTHVGVSETGETIKFSKESGCGCGSRLKSFNPFSSIAQVNAP